LREKGDRNESSKSEDDKNKKLIEAKSGKNEGDRGGSQKNKVDKGGR